MIVELNKNGYDEILKIKKDPDRINFKNELYRFLFDGSYIVDSNETEINKILLATLNQRFDPRSLSLTIAPTRACNFACPYCYEKDRASVRMTEKIQEGILEFVKKHKMIKSLFITWYGGEPTLSISTIKYLSTKMQKMVDNYSAMIITNGYRLTNSYHQ
ncbi:MAG: radical SAM protein [Odoribacter splanchnicus]